MEGSLVSVKEAEDEWKVVLRRKGKPHAKRLSHRGAEEGAYCPGYGPNSNLSSGDADEGPRMRVGLQKSMERVRSSVFFKKLVEQMQELQILEKLLANASGDRSLRLDQTVSKGDFADVPSVGPNSDDHEASAFRFSDGSLIVETIEDKAKESHAERERPGTQSHTTVELVVLGVGSILESEVSRCQMSLALLLKEHFPCIGDILVYDPVLSAMECGFLIKLGCTPIVRDEKGRRRAYCPTLFYMPHCGASLYNNVLEENQDPWCLGWISILGNSFLRYQDSWGVFPKPKHARPDCLLGMQPHVTEHPVNAASFPCVSAFNDMSWHLFPVKKIL
ncbi:hypothetical protein M758_5G169500 [Ceratodon purpureus]|nr:hypothetical protein M758_5G169500 [Ceratodon purpureus]